MNKKISVTVGIPTYFAERNIRSLLTRVVSQKQRNFILKEILVYSDGNTDSTVREARKVRSKKIDVIDAKIRHGMAYGLRYMLSQSKGELFLLINDDILIKDRLLISKMVDGYLSLPNVGLVSGNPQPLSNKSFFVRAQISTFRAFERTRYLVNKGQNKYTCDGKLLMLSRKMWEHIMFPKSNSSLGNVDVYLYMYNKKLGFNYKHVKSAKVYFEFPITVNEFVKWSSRNNANAHLLEKQFGHIAKEEYTLPKVQHAVSMMLEFAKKSFRSGVSIYRRTVLKK